MTQQPSWGDLENALERWRGTGRQPEFWLRDDDAVEPTDPLHRLTELTANYGVPLALAVIPARAQAALAEHLLAHDHLVALVHGWSHANHAPSGEKKRELGLDRSADVIADELVRARGTIETLFPSRWAPVLVPPWNRIDARLVPRLAGLGYRALSTFGCPSPAPLPTINATLDIMDWHGTRGCLPHDLLIAKIIAQLDAASSESAPRPIGLLTHHLVHDEKAWNFLEKLFEVTATRQRAKWRAIGELLTCEAPPP